MSCYRIPFLRSQQLLIVGFLAFRHLKMANYLGLFVACGDIVDYHLASTELHPCERA